MPGDRRPHQADRFGDVYRDNRSAISFACWPDPQAAKASGLIFKSASGLVGLYPRPGPVRV